MKELLEKIRATRLSKKNIILICVAVVALVILLISEFITTEQTEYKDTDNAAVYASSYIKNIEKELESLLSDIDGAGKVKVMVTLDSCYENVYAKSHSSKAEESESGKQAEMTEEYIIVKQGSNNEECLVIKVYEPAVKGVAVVAEGADDINVRSAITETVCALFDISTAKVSVEKMNSK